MHPFIFVLEEVAVQHRLAGVRVRAEVHGAHLGGGRLVKDVVPVAFHVVRVGVGSVGPELEIIDVDVVRMSALSGYLPLLHRAGRHRAVRDTRAVRGLIRIETHGARASGSALDFHFVLDVRQTKISHVTGDGAGVEHVREVGGNHSVERGNVRRRGAARSDGPCDERVRAVRLVGDFKREGAGGCASEYHVGTVTRPKMDGVERPRGVSDVHAVFRE